ncbi:MAG: hypothetical protein H6745_03725 [Deltaproteobacteria bacterium]|nr:hypothetical protein [Deltaproteobacteria bacterium]
MRVLTTSLAAATAALLALGAGCDQGPSGTSTTSAALNGADASGGDGSASDAWAGDPGDPGAPTPADAYASDASGPPPYGDAAPGDASGPPPGPGDLHACVHELALCLFDNPEPLCEERFIVCYEGAGALPAPDPRDPRFCDETLEACLEAMGPQGGDPYPCFEAHRACLEALAGGGDPGAGDPGGPPYPGDPGDPAFCEQELDRCLQESPEAPEPCFEHHRACLEATAPGGDPGGDPGDPAFMCDEELRACVDASPADPEPCFEHHRACLEAMAGPPDPGCPPPPPGDPADPGVCEGAREQCLGAGELPHVCEERFMDCMQGLE